ncbi:hypothetical protein JCM19238_5645 [Vibrio ponticus]|nr:hypothetical protein JCM19238_5645 [Vibrio ponticus]
MIDLLNRFSNYISKAKFNQFKVQTMSKVWLTGDAVVD